MPTLEGQRGLVSLVIWAALKCMLRGRRGTLDCKLFSGPFKSNHRVFQQKPNCGILKKVFDTCLPLDPPTSPRPPRKQGAKQAKTAALLMKVLDTRP